MHPNESLRLNSKIVLRHRRLLRIVQLISAAVPFCAITISLYILFCKFQRSELKKIHSDMAVTGYMFQYLVGLYLVTVLILSSGGGKFIFYEI